MEFARSDDSAQQYANGSSCATRAIGPFRLPTLRFPSDMIAFLRVGLSHPRCVGAVAPSGRALARLITSELGDTSGPVIELGAGTGVITRALIERGIPEQQLVLVETQPHFVQMLQKRFPTAQVLAMEAGQLRRFDPFEGSAAGSVVSGLPLLSMPRRAVMSIMRGAFRRLRADGIFYQYTYGPRCPVPGAILERLGLRARRIGWVPNNLPPASVYRIERRALARHN